jgi:hypothetical protein
MTDDLFVELTQPKGDLAGVFEYDGDVGYFYLYRLSKDGKGGVILGSIQVVSGKLSFEPDLLEIRWSADNNRVALFIHGTLWAVFNTISGEAFGQVFSKNLMPSIPKDQMFS